MSWHCMHLSLLTVHSPTQNTPKKKKKKNTHTHTTIWGEENSLRSRVPLNRASKNHFSLLAPQTKQTRLPSHPLLSLSRCVSDFWTQTPKPNPNPSSHQKFKIGILLHRIAAWALFLFSREPNRNFLGWFFSRRWIQSGSWAEQYNDRIVGLWFRRLLYGFERCRSFAKEFAEAELRSLHNTTTITTTTTTTTSDPILLPLPLPLLRPTRLGRTWRHAPP